jgi:hypothetical protein
MAYMASDWYWIGQPIGQTSTIIYSSAVNALVAATDANYIAWQALLPTNKATPWPQDENNEVTIAALDAVLSAAGLPLSGLATPSQAQLQAAASTKVQALLSSSRLYPVTGVSMPPGVTGISCDALQSSANVQAINSWGLANPTSTQQWTDNVFNVFILTGAQAVAFSNAVLAYGQSVYAELATVVTAIASGSITTLAQIASEAWPQ